MTIQKYDWVSKGTKLNANGWSVPLNEEIVTCLQLQDLQYK